MINETTISSTNPRTRDLIGTNVRETTNEEVDALVDGASLAAARLGSLGRQGRARLLCAVADSLESHRDRLVQTADAETGLGETRLNGELSRSAFQFRLFADALLEGSYLEAMIDHAGDTPLGPGPDLRRMLLPIGPVVVFGASNFPFAFSVAGGDTASALAAGCPVVLKAHDSHPLTSLQSFEAIAEAVASTGADAGTVALVFGQKAASHLIARPSIKAVSFTGSLSTGKVLMGIINEREEPIPFYGELSSLNPLVVTAAAAGARGEEIANGLFKSFTGSGGQLCTKPGLAFVPVGLDGDKVVDAVRALTLRDAGHVLLNQRIAAAFVAISGRLVANDGVQSAHGQVDEAGVGFVAAPTLITTRASDLSGDLVEECFGPLVIIARYRNIEELNAVFKRIPSSLTATIHAEEGEPVTEELTKMLEPMVGRIVYNGFPTGVRVSWAQHHGGPWPSTNSQHTSVGVTAIRRFLRPFVWQGAPSGVLPEELRDGPAIVPRRVDGQLTLVEGSTP